VTPPAPVDRAGAGKGDGMMGREKGGVRGRVRSLFPATTRSPLQAIQQGAEMILKTDFESGFLAGNFSDVSNFFPASRIG
jgi:hypothetical protein